MRKINGFTKGLDEFVAAKKSEFLARSDFSIVDIAAGAFLRMANMVKTEFGMIEWKGKYPEPVKYWESMEARESFKENQSYMFELTEKVA
jgi:glutathione S-transferase